MGIKTRMFIGVFGALFFLLTSNLIAQYVFDQSSQTINRIVNETQVKVALLNELKNLTDERAVLSRDLVITEDEAFLAQSDARLKETAKEIGAVFEQLEAMPLDKKEQEYFEAIQENVVAANRAFGSFKMMADEQFYQDAVEILIGEFGEKYQAFTDIVQNFQAYEQAQNAQAAQELREQEEFAVITMWSVLVVSVVLFSVAGFFVARSFMKPIEAMRETMLKIRETGELNHRVAVLSKDELGETSKAINGLLSTIHDAIDDVNGVMKDVSNGEFGNTIEKDYQGDFSTLKQGVNESVEQVHSMIQILTETAHNLRNGKFEMPSASSVSFSGEYERVMTDLSVAMERLDNSVQDIAKTLKALSRGDFSRRVTAEARGELVTLKEAINETLEGLEAFVEDVAMVQTRISEGDLTHRVQGNYHGKMAVLKDSLNSSTLNISDMIGKVGAVTRTVADEARSIADGSESISDRIQQQTQSLEQTAQQMASMTDTVRKNAESADHANEVTQTAQNKLSEGGQVMQKALASMDRMSEASQKINDIITLIDGIAFQTNLLALNAAVEAARAGEHGRGFAVVAGEVRSLAGKSSDAAADIKKLIENSVAISDESGRYVRETSDVLQEIHSSMDEISERVSTIATATNEQSVGIDSVSQSVSQMENSTQQNAGLVEEAAAGSQDLLHQASDLLDLVGEFQIDQATQTRSIKAKSSEDAQQFDKMVQAHLAWKAKIRAFVDGMDIGVTYETATDPTACVLGKWYYGEGQKYADKPTMQKLGEEHAQMHAAIKKVMDAKAIDDTETVDAGLEQVDRQSDEVVALLYRLMDEV